MANEPKLRISVDTSLQHLRDPHLAATDYAQQLVTLLDAAGVSLADAYWIIGMYAQQIIESAIVAERRAGNRKVET